MHTPPMTTKILFVSALLLTTGLSEVPTPAEDTLRQGLFEEEANRDFDKAAERYRAVVAAHDRQRALAATATFRLGEIARKKNDKEAAAAAFRTVVERFPEQADLARMSRENLSALGMVLETVPAGTAPDPFAEGPPEDPEAKEIERLKNIARNSPDLLDGATDIGWRPLHVAAANGQVKVIDYLLENKADPNSLTTREQLTPLQIAAAHGRLGAVQALLAAKARIDTAVWMRPDTGKELPIRDERADKAFGDWTALDFAVLYDRREVVRALVKAGADMKKAGPDMGGYPSFTPLMMAIYLGREDIAVFLTEAGSPLDPVGRKEGVTPLMLATENLTPLVPVLLKAGADPRIPSGEKLDTPLHRVARSGKVDRARMLTDAGADPKAINKAGQTPLHWAGSREMVEFLLSKGADPNAKDNEGLTPLDAMVMSEYLAAPVPQFDALLANGAVIADEDALLKHTAPDMIKVVRERLIYPKRQREDRVLISVMCSPGSNFVRPMDIMPAPGSPPPSAAEGLRMLPRSGNFMPGISRMKVIRREGGDRYKTVFEWAPEQSQRNHPGDIEFPPLEWGDILELALNGNGGTPNSADFDKLISDRQVDVRLGGVEFRRPLTSSSECWLSDPGKYLPEVRTGNYVPRQPSGVRPQMRYPGEEKSPVSELPLVPDFIDRSRITVTRKGVAKPIPVAMGAEDSLPFRLIEGDVIDLVLKDGFREELRANHKQLVLTTDFKYGGVADNIGLFGSVALFTKWQNEGVGFDGAKIRILREGNPEKVENIDLGKIIPEDFGRGGANDFMEELKKPDLLRAGDWILVAPADQQTQRASSELLQKVRLVAEQLRSRAQIEALQGRRSPQPGLPPLTPQPQEQPQEQRPQQRAPRDRVTPPPQSH